jgi:arylformamidase
MYELEPVRRSYLNKDARLSEHDVADLSPVRADAFLQIPVVLAVGVDESSEFIEQSESLAAAIGRLGATVSFVRVPATSHYTMLDQWRPDSDLLTRFRSLLDI